ncbi:MAG: hypothetical protein ABWY57_01485 [Mycetocola sp.]
MTIQRARKPTGGTSWEAVVGMSIVALFFGIVAIFMFGLTGLVLIDGELVEGPSYGQGEAGAGYVLALIAAGLAVGGLIFIYAYALDPAMPRNRRALIISGIGGVILVVLVIAAGFLLQGRESAFTVERVAGHDSLTSSYGGWAA